jgi:membrane-bound lytic murein transglycosylase F
MGRLPDEGALGLRALAAVMLSVLLGTCASPPTTLQRIIQSGELRVVTRNTPTAFYYGPDEPRGIEYELVKGFADRLGVDLRIYIADQVFPDLESGKAEIAAASLTVGNAHKNFVTFGPAYQNIQPEVIYRRGTRRPRSLADLLGSKLVITADSPHAALLRQLRTQEPLLGWVEEKHSSGEELLRRVETGDIDYTIADSHVFALLQHFYPDLRVAFNLGPVSSVAWALPKGEEDLREAVASYFAEIQSTGALDRILDRYYFATREFDYVGSRAFIRHYRTRLPRYRKSFEAAARATGVDWRLLAAMAYQESHWNPDAVSPTGVRGIMMLTEHTAKMLDIADRDDATESITGGAEYFARVERKVPARIPEPDRSWLAVAAYNLGYGHLEDARILTQKQGGNPDSWTQVRERLPLLSDEQWHRKLQRGYAPGTQAVTYVDNIRRYYEILMWLESRETLTQQTGPIDIEPNG